MNNPMKTSIYLLLGIMLFATSLNAQSKRSGLSVDEAMKKFPGFTTQQMQQLFKAKKYYPIPLPTWIPAGFKVEEILTLVGPKIKQEDKVLNITYSKKIANGKKQAFTIEAGIDGIGDLPYEHTHIVKTALEEVYLCYEPIDDAGVKPIKKYVRTQWFDCDGTAYAYGSVGGMPRSPAGQVMISIADTKKIIGSLQKLPKD
jgi:hypothetical protein